MTQVDFNKANEYLELCNLAEDALKMEYQTLDNGYKVEKICSLHGGRGSHFRAVLYQKDGNFVLSCLGTKPGSVRDLAANAAMVAAIKPKQFKDAEYFTKKIMKDLDIQPEKLTVIGNSEGGAEAIHINATIGAKEVYTFNAYTPSMRRYEKDFYDNVFNFRAPDDIVSKARKSCGQDFIVELKPETPVTNGMQKYLTSHRIINFGDCKNAVSVEEYKQQHPEFRNKFVEGKLYASEISEIPRELLPLFMDDIDDRINNNALSNATNPEINSSLYMSGGRHHVAAYTRDDGVHVKEHYRACAPNHSHT